MRRKDIDTMREVRLWVRDIVIPAGTAAIALMSYPATRNTVINIKNKTCDKVKKVLKKGGEA